MLISHQVRMRSARVRGTYGSLSAWRALTLSDCHTPFRLN